MQSPVQQTGAPVDASLVSYTHLMYGLHALAVAIGLFTAASVVGTFLFGLPSIAAVIMNLVRRSAARGTWLESHFRWQLRTVGWTLLWTIIATVVFGPLVLLLIGIPLLAASYFAICIWVGYRIVRGWLALRDGLPVP